MPQQENIDYLQAADPNVNAAVSASAGTGKTWLLTTRLLRLLLSGTHPGSILAITFTEKAAAEMHERLYARVRSWSTSADDQLDDEFKSIGQRLRGPSLRNHARGLYEKLLYAENGVQIMTFHAFCRKILERFPAYSGVPAGFDICEDADELQRLSLDQLMEKASAGSDLRENLDRLSQACEGLANVEKSMLSFLNHQTDWLSYTQAHADPVDCACQRLRHALNVNTMEETVNINDSQTKILHGLQDVFAASGRKNYTERALTIGYALRQEGLDLASLRNLKQAFYNKSGGLRSLSEKQLGCKDEGQAQAFMRLHQQALAWLHQSEEQLLSCAALQRNHAWYKVGQGLVETYHRLKKERQVLDFNDLEWHARQLIGDGEYAQRIIYCLNERIRHVLVDEFQDTNPDQWQLLKPFLEEVKAGGEGSVLIVGDTKQSIFGFRRANPELQARAGDWIRKNMNGQTCTMDQSRRSSPAIISFVNEVFSPSKEGPPPLLADFKRGGSALDTAGKVYRLPFFATQNKKKQTSAKQEEDGWRAILQTPPEKEQDDPAEQESRCIAMTIQRLLERGQTIKPANEPPRPLRYGDILILLRRTIKLSYLQSALRQAGVPFTGSHDENLLQTPEARDVLALLKLLMDPNDNLSLAQVLKSPMFCADDKHLMMLAENRSYYQQLKKLAGKDAHWRQVYQPLKSWIDQRDRRPLHDLLSHIYHSQDLVVRYRTLTPADRREQSEQALYALLEYTLSFDGGRWTSIQRFAFELERQLSRAAGGGKPFVQHEDKLRIMTVHKSKGLEAPVVFVADCGIHKVPADSHRALVEWGQDDNRPQTFILLPRLSDKDPLSKRCLEQQKERDRVEEMNLLYVALTRARQYLFISGHGKETGREQDSWYRLAVERGRPELFDEQEHEQHRPHDDKKEKPVWPLRTIPRFDWDDRYEERSPSRLDKLQAAHGTEFDSQDEDRLTRGQAIHRVLELLNKKYRQEEILEKTSTDFPLLSDKEIRDYYRQADAVYRDKQFAELFDDSRYEKVYNEMPLSYRQSGQYCYGIIDRLCLAADRIWLLDYKTHLHAEKKIDALGDAYHEQMQAYRCGVEKLWPGKRVRAALLFTSVPMLYVYPD